MIFYQCIPAVLPSHNHFRLRNRFILGLLGHVLLGLQHHFALFRDKHIRRHYISDDELDDELEMTGMDRYEYLSQNIIPDKTIRLGSTTISGEFAEILTYDIREHILGEQALRGRHTFKATPEQRVTGSDILTYTLIASGASDINDTLFITESKAVLSQTDYLSWCPAVSFRRWI